MELLVCLFVIIRPRGTWHGETKLELRAHFDDAGHTSLIEQMCGRGDAMDFYQEAIRTIEQDTVLGDHVKTIVSMKIEHLC